jgi:aminomethyltransferase
MLTEFYRNESVPLTRAFGREYPRYFVHPFAEYRALAGSCGVIDLTHWRVLRVTGRDRARFLNAMLTNDVASLEPSRGCHAMMTTVKGKIVSELFVFARKDDHLVIVSQGDSDETLGALRKHIVADDVAIDDVSAEHAVIAVEGPKAMAVVGLLFRPGPFPKSPLDLVEREFEKFAVTMIQNSVTGETGYHVVVPSNEALRIRNYLVQAARGSDGLPVGHDAWNIRRVENGLPWYGVDFDCDNFPQESRLSRTVSYTKGCFRGQETLARLENRGHVNRLLVGLAPEGSSMFPAQLAGRLAEIAGLSDRLLERDYRIRAALDAEALDLRSVLPAGAALHAAAGPAVGAEDEKEARAGEKPVGAVRSSVFSFALEGPLCLGYVRAEAAKTGVTIQTPIGSSKAREIELPLPSGTRSP